MGERKPTVFVVDDDPGVLDSVGFLLRSWGHSVRTFSSAMDFLEEFDPDTQGCMVLDLRMPGMSGRELQQRLAELGSDLPIIFITAQGDVPTAVDAVKEGAVDFIQKPFPAQKLLDRIQEALKRNARVVDAQAECSEIRLRLEALTPGETNVLAGVVRGESDEAIARDLGISQGTVELLRARVMERMSASSVSDLMRMVLLADS